MNIVAASHYCFPSSDLRCKIYDPKSVKTEIKEFNVFGLSLLFALKLRNTCNFSKNEYKFHFMQRNSESQLFCG